ncbi:MAG: HEAT repeat domain-containing protein [Planctomycetes bacterium]|nr:HEAT repeat domain-containing protein [Planctomycetota bacterium]
MRHLAIPFLILGVAACAAPRGPADSGRVVREDELPAREREVWESYHAGGPAWELERERVLADPGLARFLVDNLVREMVQSYDHSRLASSGERAGPFERACDELVRCAGASTPVLAEMLALRDGIVSFLAADLLARIGASALEPVRAKLGSGQAEVRRRAAELLGRLPNAGAAEGRVEEGLGALAERDPAWIVRAQAAQALGARGAQHAHKGYAAGVLARCLADPDPAVVESATKGLRALAEPRAIPILIDALERSSSSGNVSALHAAQDALRALSGEQADRSPAEWRRWWTEVGERALVH